MNILINPFICSPPPGVDLSISDPDVQDRIIPDDTPAHTQDTLAPPSADGPSKLCPAPATPQLVRAAVPAPSAAATKIPVSEAAGEGHSLLGLSTEGGAGVCWV